MAVKRVEWIDVVRGIIILGVLMAHAGTTVIRNSNLQVRFMYYFIESSAMPVMMYISGISFNLNKAKYLNMSAGKYMKKKAKSLLIPYVSYAILVYLIFEIASIIPGIGNMMEKVGYGGMPPLSFIFGLLVGNNVFSMHLWFLYALFVFEILAFLVLKFLKKDVYFIILSVLTYLLSFWLDIPFSLSFVNILAYMVFFAFGLYLGNREVNSLLGIALLLGWLILYVYYFFGTTKGSFAFYLLAFLIPCFACVGISFLGQNLHGRIKELLTWFGLRSMVLYLFQQPFFGSAFATILFVIIGIPAWPSVFLSFIISVFAPLIIKAIFARFRWFSIMFGVK